MNTEVLFRRPHNEEEQGIEHMEYMYLKMYPIIGSSFIYPTESLLPKKFFDFLKHLRQNWKPLMNYLFICLTQSVQHPSWFKVSEVEEF